MGGRADNRYRSWCGGGIDIAVGVDGLVCVEGAGGENKNIRVFLKRNDADIL